ncbi:MAG: SIMPL domain-containing protein [Limisphaerales bacterium]
MKRMCLSLLVCASIQASAQNLSLKELRELIHPATRDVSLSDSATHKVMADRIMVHASVTVSGRDRSSAFDVNRSSRDALKAALVRVGIPSNFVVNQPFSFNTRSGVFKKVRGYELSSRVTIRVTRESEFLKVLKVLESRDEEWTFKDYDLEDSRETHNQQAAMEKTLAKIEGRKSFFAKKLNLNLKAVQFQDQTRRSGGPVALRQSVSKLSSFASERAIVQSDAAFGQITYHAELTVTYAAQPLK